MNIRFLGGVAEVGRLGMVLQEGERRLLFEYGLAPHDPPEYPLPAPSVDVALLTHAHLDHSGMLPAIAAHSEPRILATATSMGIAELLAYDSLKVAGYEGYPKPYQPMDIETMRVLHEEVQYGETREDAGFTITPHSAGHIPGSTMYEVTGRKTLMFTGDVNLIDTHLVAAAEPVKCDYLVMEATYSGRQHKDRGSVEQDLVTAVTDVVDRGGHAMIPAFATGRTQELLMILADEGFDLWLDGMGKTTTRIMLDHPEFLRDPRALKEAFRRTKVVHSRNGRRHAERADVIVCTSGMLEGGPILHYLERFHDDPANAVFLSGFQVEGTNGRRLLEEGVVEINGVPERIQCEVRKFDFSGHAGHDQLVEFARACEPEKVVLMHSDNREPLAQSIREFAEVVLPETGEEVAL